MNKTGKYKMGTHTEYDRLRLLGVTPEQYQFLFNIQNGCCAICGKHQNDLKTSLSLDHDHQTGIVRGLLCGPCNVLLGIYENRKDDCEKYLKTTSNRMKRVYKEWLKIYKDWEKDGITEC